MGTLFVVATPIGNLADITFRAVKTLLTVDVIACEDTRRCRMLLTEIQKRYHFLVKDMLKNVKPDFEQMTISYYEQNEMQQIPKIINVLKNGLSVALISDAGTPLISDPGFKLVREAIQEGIKVESVPGPSSVISALVSSGLPTDKFLFVGYPPHKPGHRITFFRKIFSLISIIRVTVIFFVAPHKLIRTLEEMQEVFGNIEVCLARELTKAHEEVVSGRLSEFMHLYKHTQPKGEFVILFNISNAKEKRDV
jgi:16S rRNA (cytidine1402-2'-O)-methyltransferase